MKPAPPHTPRRRPTALAVIAIIAVVATAAGLPTPASAAPKPHDPEALVRLVEKADPHTRTTGRVTASHQIIRAAGLEVTIATRGEAVTIGSRAVLRDDGVDYVSRGVEAGLQVAAVINDPSRNVQQYRFAGRYLELTDTGRVIVRGGGSTSEPVAVIDPAWALDASGATVPTHFRVDGDTLIQTTDVTPDTPLPVVADPRVRSTWYGWSIDFSRAETRTIAQGAKACAGVAGLITVGGGIVASAVAAHCGALTLFADLAVENGKCVSLKVVITYLVTWWMPKCYK